ncbi:hypothetical protein GY50_0574 [Dehalococcoides mccartyi GY50]|nr:hypothetical protein GY50_0574 [Dehalococcoides mccartyi GY50]
MQDRCEAGAVPPTVTAGDTFGSQNLKPRLPGTPRNREGSHFKWLKYLCPMRQRYFLCLVGCKCI